METLIFQIEIHASPQKIWEVLWSDTGYRNWSSVFTPGSFAESDNWETGSLVQFLSPKGHGLYALIEEHTPNHSMVFKQLGMVSNKENQPIDAETAIWCGFHESYQLENRGNVQQLTVTLETLQHTVNYFNTTFPLALERIRDLAQSE